MKPALGDRCPILCVALPVAADGDCIVDCALDVRTVDPECSAVPTVLVDSEDSAADVARPPPPNDDAGTGGVVVVALLPCSAWWPRLQADKTADRATAT